MVSCKKWHSVSAAVHKVRSEYISFLRLCVPFEVNDFYNRQRFWSWTIWTDFWECFRFDFFSFLQTILIWRNFLGIFWKFSGFSLEFFCFSGSYYDFWFFSCSGIIYHIFFWNFSRFFGIYHIFFGNFSRFF